MNIGLEKMNQNKPTACDSCGGSLRYMGIGEYECSKCGHLMYDDYGKVRRFFDEHETSSMLILERETGVSREVLEYLVKNGTLIQPPELIFNRICNRCGYPIEKGRYCKACMTEMANELAGVMNTGQMDQSRTNTSSIFAGAKMHLDHNRKK